MTEQQRREALRFALLEWMAGRSTNSFDVEIIQLRLNRSGLIDFDARTDEIEAGLEFLRGLGLVSATHHFLGATVFFQVTSKGVLGYERNLKSPTLGHPNL